MHADPSLRLSRPPPRARLATAARAPAITQRLTIPRRATVVPSPPPASDFPCHPQCNPPKHICPEQPTTRRYATRADYTSQLDQGLPAHSDYPNPITQPRSYLRGSTIRRTTERARRLPLPTPHRSLTRRLPYAARPVAQRLVNRGLSFAMLSLAPRLRYPARHPARQPTSLLVISSPRRGATRSTDHSNSPPTLDKATSQRSNSPDQSRSTRLGIAGQRGRNPARLTSSRLRSARAPGLR